MLIANINPISFTVNALQRTFVIESTIGTSTWTLVSGIADSFIVSSNQLTVTYTIDQDLIILVTSVLNGETSNLQFKLSTQSGLTRLIYMSSTAVQNNLEGVITSQINHIIYEGVIANEVLSYRINDYPLQAEDTFNFNLITYSTLSNTLSGYINYNGSINEDLTSDVYLQIVLDEIIDLKCMVCLFIDNLKTLNTKLLYGMNSCIKEEQQMIDTLFREFMILKYSCNLYPNVLKSLKNCLNAICKQYKNCKEC